MKNLTTFTLILLLTASCGFSPLYAQQGNKGGYCKNFIVKEVNLKQIGQKLRYFLQDNLNQACLGNRKYSVKVELDKSKKAISIQKDREITRYNAVLQGSYEVYADGKLIHQGASKMIGGFDAVVSDYGTYAQEEDAYIKLAEEMANAITLKIATKLRNEKL